VNDERRDEQLLHLLLDREAGEESERTAELLRAQRDPESARQIDEFHALLERSRAVLGRREEWTGPREKALVKRVLARTTREDLRWRRDLALVAGFVRQRLGSSPVLRALAAGVLLSFCVTSVFAWLSVREPEGFTIIIDPSIGKLQISDDESGDEEEASPAADDSLAELDDAEQRALRIEQARRRDRYLVSQWRAPEGIDLSDDLEGSLFERLLRARARGLESGDWPEWLELAPTLELATGSERALLAEILLDRVLLTDEPSPLLSRTLSRVALTAKGDSPEDTGEAANDAAVALSRSALQRAAAYGLWSAAVPELSQVPEPVSREWGLLLAEAAPLELRDREIVTIWLR
jgi:hypothetical protein